MEQLRVKLTAKDEAARAKAVTSLGTLEVVEPPRRRNRDTFGQDHANAGTNQSAQAEVSAKDLETVHPESAETYKMQLHRLGFSTAGRTLASD